MGNACSEGCFAGFASPDPRVKELKALEGDLKNL
eukprot:CAMPEP_0195091064 /NCGR_PEP_ID=MMETSP0448-20130528/31766_1 /TAXON_ID=66468 /ORGANISM="Heterocapsa triquestra, Strain CCMP 448" /LENGTH=33 /DNA_ID= /DNA_START= /DNA_END= /DNA_ORIENTATION=